jgi:2-polyprenyl-3-methyl-5-hydroxy-6-metoxy-1,4-benzoquinol methylase
VSNLGNSKVDYDPTHKWKEVLSEYGYEHRCKAGSDYRRIKRLPRTWRRILRVTTLRPPARCFEVGCGGGIQVVQLALNGFLCTGIDVSPNVLDRANRFIESVRRFNQAVSSIQLIESDFMKLDLKELEGSYDLVFNVGVIEHYLKAEDRQEFLRRKLLLGKPGAFIVSIVPSGIHPFRQEKKKLGWGGYHIPEIDYTTELLIEEMRTVGLSTAVVLPHNVFGYLLARPNWWCNKITYLASQLFAPIFFRSIMERYAYSFIAIGQKPF